jgi:hypothetical protein
MVQPLAPQAGVACDSKQAAQAPPFGPHTDVVRAVTHPLLLQQPSAQLVALHATQAPAWQMLPAVPQGWPSFTLLGEVHIGPVPHVMVPVWQPLLSTHWALTVQATQEPLPSQTPVTEVV